AEVPGLALDDIVVLAGLPQVERERRDLGPVLVLDPLEHDARVEPAAVEQQDAPDLAGAGLVGAEWTLLAWHVAPKPTWRASWAEALDRVLAREREHETRDLPVLDLCPDVRRVPGLGPALLAARVLLARAVVAPAAQVLDLVDPHRVELSSAEDPLHEPPHPRRPVPRVLALGLHRREVHVVGVEAYATADLPPLPVREQGPQEL